MPSEFEHLLPYHSETIQCNGCNDCPIYGPRYKCNSCDDFDLCQSCYENNNYGINNKGHNSNHSIKLLLSDLDLNGLNLHSERCNGCNSDKYPGCRYTCEICEDFNLCSRCYEENRFFPLPTDTATHTSSHSMVSCDSPEKSKHTELEWKARAIKMQQYLGSTLGSRLWDDMDTAIPEKWTQLAKKIGFGIYGPPTIDADKSATSAYGYDKKKEKVINALRKKTLKLTRKSRKTKIVKINFVYVPFWNTKTEGVLPLIRVSQENTGHPFYAYFIEPNGRVYKSWSNFLSKNKLQKCNICVLVNGVYGIREHGFCNLIFRKSAECDTSRQLVKIGDRITTMLGIGGTIIGLIGLLTPFAPTAATMLSLTAGGTGLYGAGRSTHNLIDRGIHDQSINPFSNKEAFFSWLSVASSAFAFSSTAGLSYARYAASINRHVGTTMTRVINGSIVGSLCSSAVGIGAGIHNIIIKYNNGEISALEIFQLTASILFFTNAVVNVQGVTKIIENAQKARLNDIRSQLNDAQKTEFDRQIYEDRQKLGPEKSVQAAEVSIARMDELMKTPNWKETFGPNEVTLGPSAKIHVANPTAYANGIGVIPKEVAINNAKSAQAIRFGGNQSDKKSLNTTLAIPEHKLNDMCQQIAQQNGITNGNVQLPGNYYGWEIELGPNKQVISDAPILVENPTFSYDPVKGGAYHFVHEQTAVTKLESFPAHVPISSFYQNNKITNVQFSQFMSSAETDTEYSDPSAHDQV